MTPDAFRADPNSGKPAGQFVRFEPTLMRSALLPSQPTSEVTLGELVHFAYEHSGKLLYVERRIAWRRIPNLLSYAVNVWSGTPRPATGVIAASHVLDNPLTP